LFIRQLKDAAWVPDGDGDLQPPSSILFETLGWSADPFLLSKIHFKKPIVEELAREAGIEASVLDLLKKYGLTSMRRTHEIRRLWGPRGGLPAWRAEYSD
jgi:hypothetical protein